MWDWLAASAGLGSVSGSKRVDGGEGTLGGNDAPLTRAKASKAASGAVVKRDSKWKTLEKYVTVDGTEYDLPKSNKAKSISWTDLELLLTGNKDNKVKVPLQHLLNEIKEEMAQYGVSNFEDNVMVHLVEEVFGSYHQDAHEHFEALGGKFTQLSLGVPMGKLVSETSGLVVPGIESSVFSFSQLLDLSSKKNVRARRDAAKESAGEGLYRV